MLIRRFNFQWLFFCIAVIATASATLAQPAANTPAPVAMTESQAKAAAVDQIIASTQSADANARCNAIEAAENLPDRIVPIVQLGLNDKNLAVRFAALAVIGRLQIKTLAPSARRFLNDPNDSVRAAAMFAVRACGGDVDITPMAQILQSPDPDSRSNAAMLLGLLGDKSAIPMLKDMAKVPIPRVTGAPALKFRVQVNEAIVRLGDDASITALRACAFSQFDEVRVMAVQMLGRLGDHVLEKSMVDMLKAGPIELQLAAAESLARLGHEEGLGVAVMGSDLPLPTARAQAAMTLGCFNNSRAAEARVKLLQDPQEMVRLAAAMAVLQAAKGGPLTERRAAAGE